MTIALSPTRDSTSRAVHAGTAAPTADTDGGHLKWFSLTDVDGSAVPSRSVGFEPRQSVFVHDSGGRDLSGFYARAKPGRVRRLRTIADSSAAGRDLYEVSVKSTKASVSLSVVELDMVELTYKNLGVDADLLEFAKELRVGFDAESRLRDLRDRPSPFGLGMLRATVGWPAWAHELFREVALPKPGVAEYVAELPNARSMLGAGRVLRKWSGPQPRRALADGDGGVALIWVGEGRHVELTCDNDGETFALLAHARDGRSVVEVTNYPSDLDVIVDFLAH